MEFETAELADSFTKPSIENLDKLQLKHHKLYFEVPEYTGSEKPKFFLRVNYPVDILYTGPMIRTWCMSFEALLQVLNPFQPRVNVNMRWEIDLLSTAVPVPARPDLC